MYAREVQDRTLTFAVSGLVWQMNLVMVDQETDSLWSQLLGEAMRGPLVGATLKTIPSTMTDWGTWKQRYPETTVVVMSRTDISYTRDFQAAADNLLIGLAEGDQARAWPAWELRKQPLANDEFAGRSVVVVYDSASGTAILHGRSVDDRLLTFDLQGERLVDRETGTTWDLLSGVALTPPLQGKQLPRERGIVSNYHAWLTFRPRSTYWVAKENETSDVLKDKRADQHPMP